MSQASATFAASVSPSWNMEFRRKKGNGRGRKRA
jgi:hypothetical protein